MLRYCPPKSSIWGHSLGKMPIEKYRSLLGRFLAEATADSTMSTGCFFVLGAPAELLSRYSKLLNKRLTARTDNVGLSTEQCEVCLDELQRGDDLTLKLEYDLALLRGVEIRKWRIDGRIVPAYDSNLNLHFAAKPVIGTDLYFDTAEQFQYVKNVLADLKLCKLNEKHLKPVKRYLPRCSESERP